MVGCGLSTCLDFGFAYGYCCEEFEFDVRAPFYIRFIWNVANFANFAQGNGGDDSVVGVGINCSEGELTNVEPTLPVSEAALSTSDLESRTIAVDQPAFSYSSKLPYLVLL